MEDTKGEFMENLTRKTFVRNAESFLKKLKSNNDKDWFEDHRTEFNELVLEPAQQMVLEIGMALQSIRPGIVAIPKIDKSIFRLHRDVRFSKDKSPYKTNIGLLFWEGPGRKMERSSFYFHVEPGKFILAAGLYSMERSTLNKYREIISDKTSETALNRIINSILKDKSLQLGGKNLKRFPKGYDSDSSKTGLLLHNAIYVFLEEDIKSYYDIDIVKFALKKYVAAMPLHEWIVDNLH